MRRTRLLVVAVLAVVLPSLSQAADAKPARPGNNIIGGEPAGTTEFPFMAAILDDQGGNDYNNHFCGGSLVADNWVLTAAHCVEGEDPRDLAVAVGRSRLSSNQGERRDVVAVHVHDDFNEPIALAHDAALLQLAPRTGPSTIEPIRLAVAPGDDRFETNTWLTVIGWGTTSTRKSTYPDDLQKVDVPAVDDGTCRTSYKRSLHADSMVCAGAPNIDSCYGDSGGPLFAKDDGTGSPVQVGIVSWGNGCAKKRFPGVYSEVNNANIRTWISETTGGAV